MPGSDLVQPNDFLSGAPISQALCKQDQILSHSCPTSKRAISVISAIALIGFFLSLTVITATQGGAGCFSKWKAWGLETKQGTPPFFWTSLKDHLCLLPTYGFLLRTMPWERDGIFPLLFPDNSALFFLWLWACKWIFMLPALSFRCMWGPTASCFIIVICACVLVGKGCVLLLLFLWWFSASAFLLESVGLQQDFYVNDLLNENCT